MRFSLRTWYAAKSRDTMATLTIRGRTIFRVVRIGTPQSKYEDGPRRLGACGRVDITFFLDRLVTRDVGLSPLSRSRSWVRAKVDGHMSVSRLVPHLP